VARLFPYERPGMPATLRGEAPTRRIWVVRSLPFEPCAQLAYYGSHLTLSVLRISDVVFQTVGGKFLHCRRSYRRATRPGYGRVTKETLIKWSFMVLCGLT